MATLKVEKRTGSGKYKAFDLRKTGFIPGVIYGKGMTNESIIISLKEFAILLHKGERIIDLDVDGTQRKVIIKDVQHGVYDKDILHADFRAIREDETIDVTVMVELTGEAPGIAAGGMLEQNMHEVEVRCLPKNLPDRILVDVSSLQMGDVAYSDVLPKLDGVQYLIHGNASVVSCHHPARAEAAADASDAPAIPEVIGEKEREAKAKEKDSDKK